MAQGEPHRPWFRARSLGPSQGRSAAGRSDPGALSYEGDRVVLEDLWARILGELRSEAHDPRDAGGRSSGSWLHRLSPVAIKRGRLILSVRGERVAAWMRRTIEPRIRAAASRVLGCPIQVAVEVDTSIGGALSALGLPFPSAPPVPPPFVVRGESKLAHQALLQLARDARPAWPRVVLLGPPAVGKSHLLKVFLHLRHRHHPKERWRYQRGLNLFQEFSLACREERRSAFRGELLAHDGLVVDDFHELSRKLRCQELLVEVLEHYQTQERPVILAGAALRATDSFVPPLRSLLQAGLKLHLPQLSAATRAEILERRLPSVPGWVQDALARSARRLDECLREGAFLRELESRAGRPLQRAEVESAVPGLLSGTTQPRSMETLIARCAAYAGAPYEALVNGARSRAAALGRHLSVYVATEMLAMRRSAIERWLGPVAPSVVPYARQKVERLSRTDPRLEGFLKELADELVHGQRFLFP